MSSISSASSRTTTRDVVEAQAAALEVVDGSAGRRDDDIDARAEAAQLLADRLAAVDRQHAAPSARPYLLERLGDLHRELAGRDEDERRRGAGRRLADRRCAGGSAGRRRRSCRCPSGPRRGGRGRRAAAGSPRAGSASAPRSRAPARVARNRSSSPSDPKPSGDAESTVGATTADARWSGPVRCRPAASRVRCRPAPSALGAFRAAFGFDAGPWSPSPSAPGPPSPWAAPSCSSSVDCRPSPRDRDDYPAWTIGSRSIVRHVARPAGIGANGGGRDDAGDELHDRGFLARRTARSR